MNTRRLYAIGAVVAIAISSLFFAPALRLPVGATTSTGDSMGDDGPMLNVFVDSEPDIGDVVTYSENVSL